MDQAHGRFAHDELYSITLSPVMERTEIDNSIAVYVPPNYPSGSIFDPPEENEVPPRQQELSFDDLQEQLQLPLNECAQSSTLEPEVRLTRSKTGATSKRQSLAPEELVGSVVVGPKKKGTRKSSKKVSKETQVIPRMLAPVRKRASKKKGTKDPEMKENISPKNSNEQPQSPDRKRISKKKENEETNAPRKLQPFQKLHMTSGIERSHRSSSPFPTSASTHEDSTLLSELSIPGIGRPPRSSSSLPTSMDTFSNNLVPSEPSMNGIPKSSRSSPTLPTRTSSDHSSLPEPSRNETSRCASSSPYHAEQSSMFGISSLSEEENIKSESQPQRKMGSRKSLKTALESVPDDCHGGANHPRPLPGTEEIISTPLSGLTIQIQPRSSTFGIKVSKGKIFVSSKHNRETKKTTSTNKKKEKKKRDLGKQTRGGRRSRRKGSWTSSESDDDSSCDCSSCDPYDSYSTSSDYSAYESFDSTTSSSGCDHRHRHRHPHCHRHHHC